MFKEPPLRRTYAQDFLIKKIEKRQLRRWCISTGLSHPTMYCLAVGDRPLTYKLICSFSHLIAPIEWLFYIDEKLPYESKLVPPFDPNKLSRFVANHRFDYREIAKKYGLTQLNAYNIFVAYRARPSIQFIRRCCIDVNPIEFFINSECTTNKNYIPSRGDIVNYQNTIFLVLTAITYNTKYNSWIGCVIISDKKIDNNDSASNNNLIPLQAGTWIKGFIDSISIESHPIDIKKLAFIESVGSSFTKIVLDKVRFAFL